MRNFQTKVVDKIKTHILCSKTHPLSKIMPFMRYCTKILYSRAGHNWQSGACTLHAGCLWLQTYIQNMQYILLFHCNNGYMIAPQCYITLHCLSYYILFTCAKNP